MIPTTSYYKCNDCKAKFMGTQTCTNFTPFDPKSLVKFNLKDFFKKKKRGETYETSINNFRRYSPFPFCPKCGSSNVEKQ